MQLAADKVQDIHNALYHQSEVSYQNFQVAPDGIHLTNVPEQPGAVSSASFGPDRLVLREELRATTLEDFATRVVNVTSQSLQTLGIADVTGPAVRGPFAGNPALRDRYQGVPGAAGDLGSRRGVVVLRQADAERRSRPDLPPDGQRQRDVPAAQSRPGTKTPARCGSRTWAALPNPSPRTGSPISATCCFRPTSSPPARCSTSSPTSTARENGRARATGDVVGPCRGLQL